MKSLIILGLPRSLTTHIYFACKRVLKSSLKTTNVPRGEVLIVPTGAYPRPECPYWRYVRHAPGKDFYTKLLWCYSDSFLIKDVHNQQVVYEFCQKHPDVFNVLYTSRSLSYIAYCHIVRLWGFEVLATERYAHLWPKILACENKEDFLRNFGTPLLESMAFIIDNWCGSFDRIDYSDSLNNPNVLYDWLESKGYALDERWDWTSDPSFIENRVRVDSYIEDPFLQEVYKMTEDFLKRYLNDHPNSIVRI